MDGLNETIKEYTGYTENIDGASFHLSCFYEGHAEEAEMSKSKLLKIFPELRE